MPQKSGARYPAAGRDVAPEFRRGVDSTPPAASAPFTPVSTRDATSPRRFNESLGMKLLHAATALLDLVAPSRCASCDESFPQTPPLCALCLDALLPAEGTPERVRARFLHGGPIAAAIHRAKYGDDPSIARALGEMLRPLMPEGASLVAPIPLHRKRLISRGFNQSALLASSACARRSLSLDLLVRVADTTTQTALDRVSRRENLVGTIEVRDPRRVRGRSVVVIDDVVTTGATMHAALGALLRAGARDVLGVALASAALRHARPLPPLALLECRDVAAGSHPRAAGDPELLARSTSRASRCAPG